MSNLKSAGSEESLRTLSSIIASETELIQEAAAALPHQFSQCTYSLGYIRQAVYLCLTCNIPRGVCSACSIACHTDHEQVELFPKRHFRCDCPTESLTHPCTLHKRPELENDLNEYGQNFKGIFCRCGRPYDAQSERETMIQCVACEDWFHESCLNLREKPSSREATPVPPAEDAVNPEGDDAASEASSSGLPPPLIAAADYESMICAACVLNVATVRRYAGTKGIKMVSRDSLSEPWRVFDGDEDEADTALEVHTVEETSTSTGEKRPRDSTSDIEPDSKKARIDESTEAGTSTSCLAPKPDARAVKILDAITSNPPDYTYGRGDLFLTDDWRTRWCKCNECLPSLLKIPGLLEEEETYEPPEDPESSLSFEELGMRALQQLPRDQALDGIRAFNDMRDELLVYLRPFAQEGKVVTNEDVQNFFEERMHALRSRRGQM